MKACQCLDSKQANSNLSLQSHFTLYGDHIFKSSIVSNIRSIKYGHILSDKYIICRVLLYILYNLVPALPSSFFLVLYISRDMEVTFYFACKICRIQV